MTSVLNLKTPWRRLIVVVQVGFVKEHGLVITTIEIKIVLPESKKKY